MTLNVKVAVTIKGSALEENTRGRIAIVQGDKEHVVADIDKKDGTETYTSDVELTDGAATLVVKHLYSPDSQSSLIIDSIELDEINLGVISYKGEYRPTYPEPWYSDECGDGRKPKEVVGAGSDGSAPLWMGWEGEYTLKFQTPLYEWLLEHL
jgi:hypothetical protein